MTTETHSTMEERAQASYDDWASWVRATTDAMEHAYEYDHEDRVEELETQIQEDPLSIDRIAHNFRCDGDTWEVLMSTGGPATRLIVETDPDGDVTWATYEFQDWGEGWTPAPEQDYDLNRKYASIAGYYFCEVCDSEARSL